MSEMEAGARPQVAPEGTTIRALREGDLKQADQIMRMAFGTYLNAPDPLQVFGDTNYVHTRYRTAPDCAFAAELDGEVVGSNFATRWGSFAFFGPLTVRVDLWDQGIASSLMQPVVELFDRWGVTLAGLFTFPESPKHVGLYQKFGFAPQQLNPLMAKPVEPGSGTDAWSAYSALDEPGRSAARVSCREVADAVFPGLDLEREIAAAAEQDLGDTVLLNGADGLEGFAVCHCGPDTEAGSGTCFLKFAAVRPGEEGAFVALVDACEALADERGLGRLVAGCNTGRDRAYRALLGKGFAPFLNGLTMMRPNEPGYNRSNSFVIDDLR